MTWKRLSSLSQLEMYTVCAILLGNQGTSPLCVLVSKYFRQGIFPSTDRCPILGPPISNLQSSKNAKTTVNYKQLYTIIFVKTETEWDEMKLSLQTFTKKTPI